ncbi:MAG: hypothetical protein JO006_09560 [Paucibacter sp.]|nr:hypothetical protein [Roseateles sp.]
MSDLTNWLKNPLNDNAAATGLQAGGQLMGAFSHINYGLQAKAASDFQAGQFQQQAGQVMASSERQAFDVDLQSKYIASAALASAAASGGGASDPTVVNLMARNAAMGAYRQGVALYEGEDRARALNLQASAKEFEGKNVLENSAEVGASQVLGAGASLLKGYENNASLLSKYGAGGPPPVRFASAAASPQFWQGSGQ